MNSKNLIIGIILFIASIGVIHAMAFPQETRCILIDWYQFEKDGDLYFREDIDANTLSSLKLIISNAKIRADSWWPQTTPNPKFIYCQDEEDYKKFGVPFMTPACTHMKIGSYIVISRDGIDLDIISHEIVHTKLFETIGLFNRIRKIPCWFDEGLAMQLDFRSYYSTDSLRVKSNNFKNLPNVVQMNSYAEFGSGNHKEVMLNYSTAKYQVGKWYTREKLIRFIKKINNGNSFAEAYSD